MKLKIISALLTVALSATLLTGCSSETEENAGTGVLPENNTEVDAPSGNSTGVDTTGEDNSVEAEQNEDAQSAQPSEDEVDVSQLTLEQWQNYEYHMMISTFFQDITAYDYVTIRDDITPYYGKVFEAKLNPEATEEDVKEALQAFRDKRLSYQPSVDVESKRIYLWEEGNMPAVTEYTENEDYLHLDDPGFRPYLLEIPMADEVEEVKGTVILCSGGAFENRCNQSEAGPVATQLSALGYKCFVLNYRVQPYTASEGCLDLGRAIRYVRANAENYGIDPEKIAVMGFSAGGFLCSSTLVNFDEDVNGTVIDASYVPDELDQVSADVNGLVMVYSIVSAKGELGADTADSEVFKNAKLPDIFYIYGSADEVVTAESVQENINVMNEAGVNAEVHVLEGLPHGFGGGVDVYGTVYEEAEHWVADYLDPWLSKTFSDK